MGGGVGLTIGFIFGSWSILRYVLMISSTNPRLNPRTSQGAGPRGFLATLSQYMLSSAATFSFFLAIGSVCSPVYCSLRGVHFQGPGYSNRFNPTPSSRGSPQAVGASNYDSLSGRRRTTHESTLGGGAQATGHIEGIIVTHNAD